MKLKVNLSQSQPQQNPEESEGWLSYLNRNIATPLVKGVATRAVGSLPQQNYGLEAIRQFNPEVAQQVEAKAPSTGLASQESPHPVLGTISEIAPGFAQAGGLKSVKRGLEVGKTGLGSLIGGELGAAGAEALGLGERGQKAFGLAGSVLGGTQARHFGLKRPSSVFAEKAFEHQKVERPKQIEELKSKQKHLYNEVEKGYKDLRLPTKTLEDSLNRIEEESGFGVERKDQQRIHNTVNQLRDLFSYGTLNVQKAIKFVQNRNRAVYDQNMPPVVKQYNQQLISSLNEFIDDAGRKNPVLGRAYTDAKQVTTRLHELQDINKQYENMSFKEYQKELTNKTLGEWIGEGIKLAKGEILPSTISAIAGYFGGKTAAGITGAALTGAKLLKREVSNINVILKQNPGLKKELIDLGKAAFEEDKPLFTSIITRINDRFVKQAEKDIPSIKGKVKFR